jgi:hypothetical protein
MGALSRRLEKLEHHGGSSGRVVISASCPLPDDACERRRFMAAAFADGRVRRRRVPGGSHVHVRAHPFPLTSDEWVAHYAPRHGVPPMITGSAGARPLPSNPICPAIPGGIALRKPTRY